MPFEDEGGVVFTPPPTIVPVPIVSQEPSVGGVVTSTGAPLVTTQARPVAEAFQEANQATKIIPRATAPTPANLPQNARPGQHYTFQAQPAYEYVMGPDNVWRAIVLIPVA